MVDPMHDGSDHQGGAGHADELRVIRKLLSRAESTDFEAERDACLAKVAELMARHSIAEALVWSRHRHDEQSTPVQRLIEVPPPYAARKVTLFGVVGRHNGCTVIDLGARRGPPRQVAIIGFPGDVERTELLVTSLLLQLTRAMLAPGAAPRSAGATAAWRRSFVTAFSWRVGERLTEIRRAQEARAEAPDPASGAATASVALVLADRRQVVEDEVHRRYPRLRHLRIDAGTSSAGYAAGRAAAERAELQHSHLGGRATALPR
jgi:hypothetical protein